MKHGLRGMKHESNDSMSRITKIKTNSCQRIVKVPVVINCLEVPIPASLYETLPSTKYPMPKSCFHCSMVSAATHYAAKKVLLG